MPIATRDARRGTRSYDRHVRMGEFDSIDDELFSLDYRSEPLVAHRAVLPEPPTVRLDVRAPAHFDPGPSRLDPDDYETTSEIAIVIGFAVLLVVVVAAAGVMLWWWT